MVQCVWGWGWGYLARCVDRPALQHYLSRSGSLWFYRSDTLYSICTFFSFHSLGLLKPAHHPCSSFCTWFLWTTLLHFPPGSGPFFISLLIALPLLEVSRYSLQISSDFSIWVCACSLTTLIIQFSVSFFLNIFISSLVLPFKCYLYNMVPVTVYLFKRHLRFSSLISLLAFLCRSDSYIIVFFLCLSIKSI